jgi:hypothetical protein
MPDKDLRVMKHCWLVTTARTIGVVYTSSVQTIGVDGTPVEGMGQGREGRTCSGHNKGRVGSKGCTVAPLHSLESHGYE